MDFIKLVLTIINYIKLSKKNESKKYTGQVIAYDKNNKATRRNVFYGTQLC